MDSILNDVLFHAIETDPKCIAFTQIQTHTLDFKLMIVLVVGRDLQQFRPFIQLCRNFIERQFTLHFSRLIVMSLENCFDWYSSKFDDIHVGVNLSFEFHSKQNRKRRTKKTKVNE